MFDNPFTATNLGSGVFVPQFQVRPKAQCYECTDALSRDGESVTHKVPIGTLFIWSTRHMRVGIKRPIRGRYAEIMVPIGYPMPSPPAGSDIREWKICGDCPIWLDAHDEHPASLRRFVFDSKTNVRAIVDFYHLLSCRKEMQMGQIPVCADLPIPTLYQ